MLPCYQEGVSVGLELLHKPHQLEDQCKSLRTTVSQYLDKYKPTYMHANVLVGLVGTLCRDRSDALTALFDHMAKQPGRQAILIDPGGPKIPVVWALDWPVNEPTAIHDHADSIAGICVFRGKIFNDAYYPLGEPEGEFEAFRARSVLDAHSFVACPEGYIHQVGGLSKRIRAASVHAYYDRLDFMRFYHYENGMMHKAGEWRDMGIV